MKYVALLTARNARDLVAGMQVLMIIITIHSLCPASFLLKIEFTAKTTKKLALFAVISVSVSLRQHVLWWKH